jgi:dihydroorotate dehydrogenase electron transfer subunit
MTKIACGDSSVVKYTDLKNDYYSITFRTISQVMNCRPGQFVHLGLKNSNLLFRRAFSIASVNPDKQEVELIFKVFGRATHQMGQLCKGDEVSILGPLGKPFTLPRKSETTIIVAGGVGFPPLLFLAQRLVEKRFDPQSIQFFYGGRSKGDIILTSRIKKLGVNFRPVTEDGSVGEKGLITGPLEKFIQQGKGKSLRIYGCGPEGMLKAVDALARKLEVPGELSLEAPMPCGIGVCLGCVVKRADGGHSRVCIDGPVFEIGEIVL